MPGAAGAGFGAIGFNIGPFKLLSILGEGGCGIVYLAEQAHPVRRRVALKIIKVGMDTREVVARFEAERQALAMMDHPNIARVLDAGETEAGRPYFVMELVHGEPITQYCDRHKLTIAQRLELLIDVCHGVQHAHQKGIIHRDLKPSNVLVAVHDDKPVPRIIDFGVAKATAQRLTERTLFTEQGQLIGTPEYMSPEQAEMSATGIDTRSDVYSVGVLLYELLTGALPFGRKELREAGFAEIQRIIREVDPPRPSTRLSSQGEKSRGVAETRRSDTRALVRRLRGDLDRITMKALEKDRTYRYASAATLAEDLRRYLANEPVKVGRRGIWHRVRGRTVKRSRPSLTAALIGVAVIAAVTATAPYIWHGPRSPDVPPAKRAQWEQLCNEWGWLEPLLVYAIRHNMEVGDEYFRRRVSPLLEMAREEANPYRIGKRTYSLDRLAKEPDADVWTPYRAKQTTRALGIVRAIRDALADWPALALLRKSAVAFDERGWAVPAAYLRGLVPTSGQVPERPDRILSAQSFIQKADTRWQEIDQLREFVTSHKVVPSELLGQYIRFETQVGSEVAEEDALEELQAGLDEVADPNSPLSQLAEFLRTPKAKHLDMARIVTDPPFSVPSDGQLSEESLRIGLEALRHERYYVKDGR